MLNSALILRDNSMPVCNSNLCYRCCISPFVLISFYALPWYAESGCFLSWMPCCTPYKEGPFLLCEHPSCDFPRSLFFTCKWLFIKMKKPNMSLHDCKSKGDSQLDMSRPLYANVKKTIVIVRNWTLLEWVAPVSQARTNKQWQTQCLLPSVSLPFATVNSFPFDWWLRKDVSRHQHTNIKETDYSNCAQLDFVGARCASFPGEN